jgi:hypothetical protein
MLNAIVLCQADTLVLRLLLQPNCFHSSLRAPSTLFALVAFNKPCNNDQGSSGDCARHIVQITLLILTRSWCSRLDGCFNIISPASHAAEECSATQNPQNRLTDNGRQ